MNKYNYTQSYMCDFSCVFVYTSCAINNTDNNKINLQKKLNSQP